MSNTRSVAAAAPPPLELRLEIEGPEDAERVEQLAASLRRELLDLGVDGVDRATDGAAPEGARAVEVLAVGALLVKIARSAGDAAKVVAFLRRWSGRSGRSIKLTVDGDTIEVTAASSEQQERLIDAWIERQARAS
jgi:hypothetical protein